MKIREIVEGMIYKTGVIPLPPEKTCDILCEDLTRKLTGANIG